MCQTCGHEVEFFAGTPTGNVPFGTIGFDTLTWDFWVYNGTWQEVGSAFTGSFSSGGGVINASPDVSFFNGAPTGSAPQGQVAFDTSSSPYQMYVYAGGWQAVCTATSAAPKIQAVCGPNIVFGVANPPPPPPAAVGGVPGGPPVGTIYISTAGGNPAAYVYYPPGGGDGYQPIKGCGAAPVTKRIFLTDNTLTSWTAPGDFNPLNNKIEIVAHGGTGADGTNAPRGGGGGGGGGYAFKNNANIHAGDTVTVKFSLLVGNTVSIDDRTATVCCEATWGAAAAGPTGGAGGTMTVGDGGATGGTGGNVGVGAVGGGGGGGSAGTRGNGANGGEAISNSGGGGGGADNGTAGNLGGLGTGGNGGAGTGTPSVGGTGSTYPPALVNGGNGTGGGGGGGAGGAGDSTPGPTGIGGNCFGDKYWDPANDGCTGGSGGGGGFTTSAGGNFAGPGGTGFSGFGGGAGGSGGSPLGTAGDNVGAPGMIVITYTT